MNRLTTQLDVTDDTPLCPTCLQPAEREVFRPLYGDPIHRWRCPVNGDVVGTTTRAMLRECADRRAS